jgi:hypothetical protein
MYDCSFVRLTLETLYQCELYILPTHTEEPKDVTTSSGLLLIKRQCHVLTEEKLCLFPDFFLSSTDPVQRNFVMIL